MKEFNIKKYLAEGKLLKENSDDYIIHQNSGYLVDQIADDMMYGEFDSKEDINKFLDSIIAGIEELRSQQLSNFKEITYLPDANSEGDDLEEGRQSKFDKALKSASEKLAEDKLVKENK